MISASCEGYTQSFEKQAEPHKSLCSERSKGHQGPRCYLCASLVASQSEHIGRRRNPASYIHPRAGTHFRELVRADREVTPSELIGRLCNARPWEFQLLVHVPPKCTADFVQRHDPIEATILSDTPTLWSCQLALQAMSLGKSPCLTDSSCRVILVVNALQISHCGSSISFLVLYSQQG